MQFPPIIVRRDYKTMLKERGNTLQSIYVLDEFRKRGADLVGAVILQAVQSGVLTIWRDLDRDQVVFEWTPPPGWMPKGYDPDIDGPAPAIEVEIHEPGDDL